jgi:hypothetical protein
VAREEGQGGGERSNSKDCLGALGGREEEGRGE